MPGLHGSSIRTAECGPIRVTEKRYPAGLELPRHSHDAPRFCLLLFGTYSESWPISLRERARGALTFHPASEDHRSIFHAEACCLHLELIEELPDTGPARPLDRFEPLTHRLVRRLAREWRDADECSMLSIEGLASELFVTSTRRTPAATFARCAVRAMELIRHRATERLSLSGIAQEIGVHPVYLGRDFRRTYGCSVGEAVRMARVEAALALMKQDLPLSEVATRVGFADQSHMTRTIRRVTGLTPSQLRDRGPQIKPD